MLIRVHVSKIFVGLLALTAAQAHATSWTVDVIKYPAFYYEPVYAEYDCDFEELYISLPEEFNIQFDDDIEVTFGTETVSLEVVDASIYRDDDGLMLQELILKGDDMTDYMVDANNFLLLPDSRVGVGIPLEGFENAISEACDG